MNHDSITKTEEQLMQYLWKRNKAFMKDLLGDFSDPKTSYNNSSHLLKRLADKGFIGYKVQGKV